MEAVSRALPTSHRGRGTWGQLGDGQSSRLGQRTWHQAEPMWGFGDSKVSPAEARMNLRFPALYLISRMLSSGH